MVQTETKKVSRIKTRKKTWYKIVAPKVFGQKEIGETYLSKAEDALGRSLKINLKELTGNVRDQNVYLNFRMDKVDGTTIRTSVIGYHLTPAIIRRLVRKNTDRVDDYFIVETKSGQEVVIKTLLITIRKAQRSVQTQLRKLTQEVINEEMKSGELGLFVTNLVNGQIRTLLKKKLNKIYPLREATVRVLAYQGEGRTRVIGEESAPEGPAQPTPDQKPTKPTFGKAKNPPDLKYPSPTLGSGEEEKEDRREGKKLEEHAS